MKTSVLLKIARAVLAAVIDTMNKQVGIVQQQAQEPLEGFVKQVMGGIWKGPDADKFVSEVQKLVVPKVQETHTAIHALRGGVERAAEVIVNADRNAANNMISELDRQFADIYK